MTPTTSYDPAFFARLWEVEDKHFWFRARNTVIKEIVKRIVKDLPSGFRALEIGCGTGNVLRHLEELVGCDHIIGLDLFFEGLRFARQRVTCPLVQADICHPPFRAKFDLIGMFDVLEHLPDDVQTLRDVHALMAPGGTLLLTVPAHRSLWSYFDEASHHVRRYASSELERKLADTGFAVGFISPYMASIFPLVWLGRRVAARRKRNASDLASKELQVTPGLNGFLVKLLSFETRFISSGWRLPGGTSLIAVASRRW